MRHSISKFLLTLGLLSSAAFADTKEITIEAGGKPALKLSVPKDAEIKAKGEKTSILTKSLRVYVWVLPKAKTVADAVPHAADAIKSEFVHFAPTSNETLKVLGHEAKQLSGKGEEEDDNDPGTADVVIFTDGKNVYAACTHGEGDEAAKERPEFLKLLKAIKAE